MPELGDALRRLSEDPSDRPGASEKQEEESPHPESAMTASMEDETRSAHQAQTAQEIIHNFFVAWAGIATGSAGYDQHSELDRGDVTQIGYGSGDLFVPNRKLWVALEKALSNDGEQAPEL